MYRRFVNDNHVFFIHLLPWNMRLHCFVTINRWFNAARSPCRRIKFHRKGIKLRTFPQVYALSLCGIVVRCGRYEPRVPGSSPTQLLFPSFFFFSFFVLLFSMNIYINNCYLIKCNKQQEKYGVSIEEIVHRISLYIKYMDEQSEFLSLPNNLLWENQS